MAHRDLPDAGQLDHRAIDKRLPTDNEKQVLVYLASGSYTFDADGNMHLIADLHLSVDSKQVYVGAGHDMSLSYDGSDGHIKTDLVAASDLNVDCGAQKTIVLQTTVWDDLRVPMSATKKGGVNDPNFAQVKDNGAGSTGVFTYLFDKNAEEELFFSAQFPHSRKSATDIVPHVHWSPIDADTGVVRWGLEYTWIDINGTFGNTSIVYVEDAGDGSADKQQVAAFSPISGSGIVGISSMLIGRVFRDAAHGNDTYDADAALLEFDVHFEIDTIGSRQATVK